MKKVDPSVSIKRLYDYTKFHTGLYGSLVFGVVALIGISNGSGDQNLIVIGFAAAAVICWIVAGIAGGVILAVLVDLDCSLTTFQNNRCGPFGLPIAKGRTWEVCEHIAFWLGVLAAFIALVFLFLGSVNLNSH